MRVSSKKVYLPRTPNHSADVSDAKPPMGQLQGTLKSQMCARRGRREEGGKKGAKEGRKD